MKIKNFAIQFCFIILLLMSQRESNPEMIQKIKQNDIDAFELIFKTYYKVLVRFAMQYIKDQDEAENIVQDVMYRFWENRKRLDPEKNIKAYLYTSVKNQALSFLKHQKIKNNYNQNNPAIHIDHHSPEQAFQTKELEVAIQASIGQLPETCRRIFCMNRFENLTYKEIASIQGVSVKAVEKQMTRAFKLLRKHLGSFLTHIL